MLRHTAPHARTLALLLMTAAFAVTTACARPARVVVRSPQPQPKVVVVAKNHVHSNHCGHYRQGNTWYVVKGHKHGRNCGHVKVRGVWVIR